MLCHLTHGTSDNCGLRVRLASPGQQFVGWAQAKRNGAGGRFGLPSAFWGMAGVWLGCVGFHVSAALGAGLSSGVSCWPRGGSVPETREVPPKTARVRALGVEDAEPAFRLEMVKGTGLPGARAGSVLEAGRQRWADSGCGWA